MLTYMTRTPWCAAGWGLPWTFLAPIVLSALGWPSTATSQQRFRAAGCDLSGQRYVLIPVSHDAAGEGSHMQVMRNANPR